MSIFESSYVFEFELTSFKLHSFTNFEVFFPLFTLILLSCDLWNYTFKKQKKCISIVESLIFIIQESWDACTLNVELDLKWKHESKLKEFYFYSICYVYGL